MYPTPYSNKNMKINTISIIFVRIRSIYIPTRTCAKHGYNNVKKHGYNKYISNPCTAPDLDFPGFSSGVLEKEPQAL